MKTLARFFIFNAVWNNWITFPVGFPPPPPPHPHTEFEISESTLPSPSPFPPPPSTSSSPLPPHTQKNILNFVCHYVLILCTLFTASLFTDIRRHKLLIVCNVLGWIDLFSTNLKVSKVSLQQRLYPRFYGGAQLSREQVHVIYLYII